MNTATLTQSVRHFTSKPSLTARQRMLSRRGEPLFLAGWRRVLMIHLEVDATELQRDVPFPLDLHEGRAFVSLVAFTMCGMPQRLGGKLAAWLFRPVATHDFLNVRTYVRHQNEPGIHFLAEWLSSRLAVKLGPATFGLPYRYGRIACDHDEGTGVFRGRVASPLNGSELRYHAAATDAAPCQPCGAGSLTEWLMERYTAFNSAGPCKRLFRIWHPPWPQQAVEATLADRTLLTQSWPWFREARLMGGNYSPGWDEVWMGRPHFC